MQKRLHPPLAAAAGARYCTPPFLLCLLHPYPPLVLVNYPPATRCTISWAKLREAFGRKECVQLWSIKVGGLVGEFCAEERSLIILIKTGRGRAFTPLPLAAGSALFVQRVEKQLNIRCAARLEGFKGVHMKAYYGMNYHAKYLLSSFTQLVGPRNQAFIRVSPLRCLRSAFEVRNQPFCPQPPVR